MGWVLRGWVPEVRLELGCQGGEFYGSTYSEKVQGYQDNQEMAIEIGRAEDNSRSWGGVNARSTRESFTQVVE